MRDSAAAGRLRGMPTGTEPRMRRPRPTGRGHTAGVAQSRGGQAARRWLIGIEFAISLCAVGGAAYGLSGAENMPPEWLDGTPFRSYLVPSLVLLVAVGGGMALAGGLLLTRNELAPEATVTAGLILAAWILVQVLIIVPDGGFSWLQPAMFAIGLVIVLGGLRLRREERS